MGTNKTAVEALREKTVEFNFALRESVKRKFDELVGKENVDNVELYRFNLEKAQKDRADLTEPIPVDSIEYFWIEYTQGNVRMKFAFFYRDIDAGSGNVHVIPGIFEEYRYENPGYKPEEVRKPYVFIENGTAKVKDSGSSGCTLFAERDIDGGWWVPTSDCIKTTADDHIPEENCIKGFEKLATDFRQKEASMFEQIGYPQNYNDIPEGHKSGGKKPKYKMICYCYFHEKKYFMDMFNLIYFWGYGFFAEYNCINFTTKDIANNYPVVIQHRACKSPFSLTDDNLNPKKVKEKFENFIKETQAADRKDNT
ncbi:MAG: hypothetical protein NC299_14740 [Lachnospiraceae bacterium]|nr:hypothetical protein [Ruminococcus sp.]MCM1276594.1 hypothetical protein [Lachnospiraceae bacterium]